MTSLRAEPRILVVYHRTSGRRGRSTVDEHLYCFRRYVDGVRFDYFNAAGGFPRYLSRVRFSGVILHYTFMALRWSRDLYLKLRPVLERRLDRLSGYKVAIPQDEYAETDLLWALFRRAGVKTVFTCFKEQDFEAAYPESETGVEHLITVHPGYIDERAARRIQSIAEREDQRPIDVGYRARQLPYWLGRHGQLKLEVAQRFAARLEGDPMVADVSTDDGDAFLGDDWYRFLSRCRVAPGCEGGASLLDVDGTVRPRVDAYARQHPEASFEEVESACFPGMDGNISLFALSPRHFECTIARTCQALVEGEYGGIFRPGEHYIEIQRDFSNLDEVIERIRDRDACRRLADAAYRDIYESGRYTYRVFARQVVDHLLVHAAELPEVSWTRRWTERALGAWLRLRERLDPVLAPVLTAVCLIRGLKLGVVPWALKRLRPAPARKGSTA